MISKSQIKLITSLQQKKYRDKSGLFVAEGAKVISELLSADFELVHYFTSEGTSEKDVIAEQISQKEMQRISALKTANAELAVFGIPKELPPVENGLTVALDSVRDPGNLGTIIRLCDWFGVRQLLCSNDTVDCFNPKVVQASMGSIARVQVNYVSLMDFLKDQQLPVYGAVMEGENVYSVKLPEKAILVLGNEGKGISEEVFHCLDHKVTIPRFGALQAVESLNVATAAAILLSEFRRPIER